MTGTLSSLSLAWIPFPAFFLIRLGSILRCFTQFFRQRNLVNALIQEVFNGLELLLFLFTHERNGTSVVIGTCRTPDAMGEGQRIRWAADKMEEQCFGYIRETVEATSPDFIIVAGDLVYGRFDDNGSALSAFSSFMGTLGIPWAPVFGNHDNESEFGVDWQCKILEKAKNCLFRQGDVTGNCNYSVGIVQGGELKRIFFMLDNNCCTLASERSRMNGHSPLTYRIMPDQIEWIESTLKKARESYPEVKASFTFHLAFNAVYVAMERYGIKIGDDNVNTLIDTLPDKEDGDFGYIGGKVGMTSNIDKDGAFFAKIKELGVDSVFLGHEHANSSSIVYDGVRFQFGQKSSTYDGYNNLMDDGSIVYAYYNAGKPLVGGTSMKMREADGAIFDGKRYLCRKR